ncbi:MAG: hypothetical protein RQ758_04840 [Methanomicrobiaceae archaeon]|nr:hypothetical protein [Methanomicrobiaceae archaeon]
MMKSIIVFLLLICALPLSVAGQGPMMYQDEHGFGMMQTIEERSMNATIHEEMEDLMIGMMEGDLAPPEQERLVELMNQYPAGYSTMMNRLLYADSDLNHHMIDGEFWAGMPWWMVALMVIIMLIGTLCILVWLVVGILAISWLQRQSRGS